MKNHLSTAENFQNLYQTLSRFEQIVLQICSVIYEPSDSSTLLRCLYSSKIATNHNFQDYPRQINICYKNLRLLGLMLSNWQCSSQYVELASRQAVSEKYFHLIAATIQKELPARKFPLSGADPKNSLRDLRIDLYNKDIEKFHQQLVILLGEQRAIASFSIHPMVTICNNPFEPGWFSTLPIHIQFFAMHEIIKYSVVRLKPLTEHLNFLQNTKKTYDNNLLDHPSFLYLLISVLILQGELEQAELFIEQNSHKLESLGLRGWLTFVQGKNKKALQFFQEDLESLHTLNKRNDAYFTGIEGLIYILALLKDASPESTEKALQILQSEETGRFSINYETSYKLLKDIAFGRAVSDLSLSTPLLVSTQENSMSLLFLALHEYLKKGRLNDLLEQTLKYGFEEASANGYNWIAMEFAEILARTTEDQQYKEFAKDFRDKTSAKTLVDAIPHRERWQLALEELNILNAQSSNSLLSGTRRLVWMISQGSISSFFIVPKEQRLSENGTWSRGRTLSAKRVFHQDDIDYLTEQDKQISSCIKRKKSTAGGISYYFDVKSALLAMAGHKAVFWADAPHSHIEVIKGEPELRIKETDSTLQLSFHPVVHNQKIVVIKENQSVLKVIPISDEHKRVSEIIGPYTLTVPKKEKNQALQTIGRTAQYLNVFSDIGGIDTTHKKMESDSRVHIQILPEGAGFMIKMFVRPFNSQGPYFIPGQGPMTIFSEIKGERVQTKRNRILEKEHAKIILDANPQFHLYESGDMEWHLPSPTECLEFLYSAQIDDSIVIEWPRGEQFKISHSVGTSQCHLNISHKNNWFDIDGHLDVSESEILSIRETLALVRVSHSRFIQLSEGKFIALTQQLYNYLETLETSTEDEGNSLIPRPFSFLNFDEYKEVGFQVEVDKDWQERTQKIKSAEKLEPKIPSTLQAELRDYQKTGFCWMMKLSHWGAGACLADDMGIGKTIQALSVILAQAAQGPSLIVAPTSVCFNWQDEMIRFTPTLKIHGFNGEDRIKTIQDLGPFDVFITSYGLLQQEEEIANKEWQVIVLDEAQAIKNAHTKRSDAAMALKGAFRVVTTGTPIENNLSELWNLFRFVNPGLLGSMKQFNKRFATPIEKDKNIIQRNRLRNLISPFILRRLKSQVLQELPARTEVNLFVDFSDQEKNFYEALRRQSLEKIQETNHQGRARIQILAEIMRLRRACCNPKLILPETEIESSKLALFEETISELRSNNHKILVFSQFVDHLSIIKESLRKMDISYQYLDGSTPAKVRKMRVDAFQSGQGDVFLISLKAGGVGLNLTAANYVIHMDPWWNPAVEDQASDRAHRIGQKNPVTIYRLVTRKSIEEKIIQLHKEKKDLANSLLEGTDMAGSFSAEALLQLLQDG